MTIDINSKIIKSVPFLTDNFSERFLLSLSRRMKDKVYGPDEILYKENESADYLYILHQGELSFFIEYKLRNKRKV